MGYINGPPAQGQPEVIAALRDAVAARPGAGIAADPTGANYFAMPQPNGTYGTAFDQLLNAMVARGPQEKSAEEEKKAATQPSEAIAGIEPAALRAWQQGIDRGSYRGQGMSDILWRKSMEEARAAAEKNGATADELAAWDEKFKTMRPPQAPAVISDRGGVR